jgi:hypothetical protein
MEKEQCQGTSKPRVIRVSHSRIGDHWVIGDCGNYRYEAKVYDEGSIFGIDDGRISKLSVQKIVKIDDRIEKPIVANYDRGWDIKPESENDTLITDLICMAMEDLPPENLHDEKSCAP